MGKGLKMIKKKIVKKKKIIENNISNDDKQFQPSSGWDDLFEDFRGNDWKKEWQDMPEFVQEDLMPWRTVYVHFENQEDLDEFAKITNHKFTNETKYIWFPIIERMRLSDCRYIDE